MLCDLCKLFTCTQSHILQCPNLTSRMIVDQALNLTDKFIYGTVDQQLIYVKIYQQFWELREELLKKLRKLKTVTVSDTSCTR